MHQKRPWIQLPTHGCIWEYKGKRSFVHIQIMSQYKLLEQEEDYSSNQYKNYHQENTHYDILDLSCAQSVSGNIDDVIHPSSNVVVAIFVPGKAEDPPLILTL